MLARGHLCTSQVGGMLAMGHLGQRQEGSLAGLLIGDTLGWHIGYQAEEGEGQSGWKAVFWAQQQRPEGHCC